MPGTNYANSNVDLSIFRAGPGSGRAQKIFCYFMLKKSSTHWARRASIFRPGSGLGGPPAHFIV
jgi:hypothetical protein